LTVAPGYTARAVGFVDEDDLQTAQVAAVLRNGGTAVGRGEHVGSDAACDVDTAMGTRSCVALWTPPIAKAGKNSRRSISRGSHRTQTVRQGQNHEKHHGDAIDGHEKEPKAPFAAVAAHELNKRVHE